MDGLLFLLVLIGASFFVMTRFAGGSHAARGHHDRCCGHPALQKKIDKVDPVCGQEVSDNADYSRSYGDQTYIFCSRECLDDFEADPKKYIKSNEGGDASLAA